MPNVVEFLGELLQDAVAATADGVSFDVSLYHFCIIQIFLTGGPPTFTVTFEGSLDNTNWFSLLGNDLSAVGSATTATAAGAFRFDVMGLVRIRARISAYSGSGSITVFANAQTEG